MDPAVDLPVLPPFEERARVTLFPIGINPVVDPVNAGQFFWHKACCSAIIPARKADKDMPENVLSPMGNPGYKVPGDPFLVPSPLFTALPALPAVLDHTPGISRE
jgi:hypothetical protein